MNIAVCIKQVPDTTEVRLDPKTNTLIRDGVPSIINPDDKAGLEAALQLKDKDNSTKITVVCMGPPQAEMALREALAMGCDEAVLATSREFGGSDTYATATILAAVLRHLGSFDLVITGRQAIDGDTAQVGPQLAEQLGLPQVSYAQQITPEAGAVVVKQQFEETTRTIRVKTPCLLTALSDLAEPRYMTVGGIEDAFAAEIKTVAFDDVKDKLNPDFIGLKGSPTNVVESFTKQAKPGGTLLDNLSGDEAVAAIVEKLREKSVV